MLIRIDRYEVHNMSKYDDNASMCGYVHINLFIYSSVFVHGFSGLFFYGGWVMARGHFHASKVVYQRNAETTVAKTSDGKVMDPHDRFRQKIQT